MVKIKVKKLHPEAVLPKMMTDGAVGFDLTATSVEFDKERDVMIYGTGLVFDIPKGYGMFIFPRSSVYKLKTMMANSVAVIDQDYRGEVHVILRHSMYRYAIGDRIAQAVILPVPDVEYEEVDELSETIRGDGGLGSTGYSDEVYKKPTILNTLIEETSFNARVKKRLKYDDCDTIGDMLLKYHSEIELQHSFYGIGRKSLYEIHDYLSRHGLFFSHRGESESEFYKRLNKQRAK